MYAILLLIDLQLTSLMLCELDRTIVSCYVNEHKQTYAVWHKDSNILKGSISVGVHIIRRGSVTDVSDSPRIE
jgi:hypothetical protein